MQVNSKKFMSKLSSAIKEYKFIFLFLLGYIAFRVLIINVNATEWGDSFRILRAAEYLLKFSYPLDEKRLPFFSAILAPGLLFMEPVLWGRIFAIGLSVSNLVLIALLTKIIFPKSKNWQVLLTLVFVAFNPIFFYWSLRIMAETTAATLVLLSFVIYLGSGKKGRLWPDLLLGLILALAALTRYEGFLLAGAFGLSFLIKRDWGAILRTFSVFVVLVVPWFVLTKFILKGSTSNAYVSELETFKFDLYRLGYFLTYSLFFLGFPSSLVFLVPNVKKKSLELLKKNLRFLAISPYLPLILFLIFEAGLFFVWTPSLPRIMVLVLPIVVIFVTQALLIVDLSVNKKLLTATIILLSLLFLILQFKYRLYFLVLSRSGLAAILLLTLLGGLAVWFNNRKILVTTVIYSLIFGSVVVVANQRLVYSTIYQASLYAISLPGNIAYSDETGVSTWYLGSKGLAYPADLNQSLDQQHLWLLEHNVSYVLDTNEFNRGSKLDVSLLNCSPKFEVTIADFFDSFLIKWHFLKDRSYTVLYSQLCKVE